MDQPPSHKAWAGRWDYLLPPVGVTLPPPTGQKGLFLCDVMHLGEDTYFDEKRRQLGIVCGSGWGGGCCWNILRGLSFL